MSDEVKIPEGFTKNTGDVSALKFPEGTRVTILYRDGRQAKGANPEHYYWKHLSWSMSSDIIAYRVEAP